MLFNNQKTQSIKTIKSMLNQKFRIAIVNVGNNFYYRCSDVFNPFIGPDIKGRILLKRTS